MSSNEHPDMHGNWCDLPIACDRCGGDCRESDVYGSINDEDKNFCSKQCADDFDLLIGEPPAVEGE